jgi:hypothetical protein
MELIFAHMIEVLLEFMVSLEIINGKESMKGPLKHQTRSCFMKEYLQDKLVPTWLDHLAMETITVQRGNLDFVIDVPELASVTLAIKALIVRNVKILTSKLDRIATQKSYAQMIAAVQVLATTITVLAIVFPIALASPVRLCCAPFIVLYVLPVQLMSVYNARVGII